MLISLASAHRSAAFFAALLATLILLPNVGAKATTAELLKAAANGPKDARYTAIDDLGERHEDAATAVPQLEKLLTDADAQIRWRTVRSLGEYGGFAKSAAPAIRKLLADKDPVMQYHAAVALGKLEDRSDETIEALLAAATSKDARVVRAAIGAIRSLQPGPKRVAEVLGKALRSNDQAITLHALEVIVEQGANAVPFLKEALKNPDTAYLACTAVEQIGPDAAGTVPELTAILEKTKHSQMLIQTLLALASIGPGAAPAAPQITPLLEHQTDDTVPVAAAYALGSIGAKNVDQQLKVATKANNEFLQMIAAWALAKIHPNDQAAMKTAVDELTQGLKNQNAGIRTAAARSLQSLNAPPELVGPPLVALLNDPDPHVQANVLDAIASRGESIVPRVINALKKPEFRSSAVRVITKLGPKASATVEPLIEVAQSADPMLRTEIQLALGAIGPAAAPATEMLAKSIKSSDAGERESALYALRQIGPGARAAAKALAERMAADESFDADAAAWALARIVPSDANVRKAVLAKLMKGIESSDEHVRMESIEALGDLGAAGEARAALEKAAKEDGSPVVRAAAEEALKKK